MGVQDGQPVKASITNPAFINKNVNDQMPNKLDFTDSDSVSGAQVLNTQKNVNALWSFLGGAINSAFNALPSWATSNRGVSSDSVKQRVEAIDTAFDPLTGHTHDGSAGNGPNVDASSISSVPLAGYAIQGTDIAGVTGSSSDVSTQFSGSNISNSPTDIGVVVNAPYNKIIIRNSLDNTEYKDGSGNIVYGRLTTSAGVWTLSYYTDVAGTETAYTFGSASGVRFYYQYLQKVLSLSAPVYSELFFVPSDNATADILPATTTIQGKTNLAVATPSPVASTGAAGTANARVANADHAHAGVHSVNTNTGAQILGDVSIKNGINTRTKQSGQNITPDLLYIDPAIDLANCGWWILDNATYDDVAKVFNRIDITKTSFAMNLRAEGPIPGEVSTTGIIWWKAQPGANPISSTYASIGGWENMFLCTEFSDFVIGGLGIELDGDGNVTNGYGRVVNNNQSGSQYIAMLSNAFADYSGTDDITKPSWRWGMKDDSFVIERAIPTAGVPSFTTFFSIDNTGAVTISGGIVVSAAAVAATTTGHNIATGANVQLQLDELDAGLTAAPPKNFIINGNIDFDQRNEGASQSFLSSGSFQEVYGTDRFRSTLLANSTAFRYAIQTITSDFPPNTNGFNSTKCLAATITTAGGISGAGKYWNPFIYTFEGLDYAQLHGRTVTFGFWFKATTTGTYNVTFRTSSGATPKRAYCATFTVSASNTWEYKKITLTLDSGNLSAWGSFTTAASLFIEIGGYGGDTQAPGSWTTPASLPIFSTGLTAPNASDVIKIGQVSLYLGTYGADDVGFQRVGSTIQEELVLCQRYFFKTYPQGTAPGGVTLSGAVHQRAGTTGSTQVMTIPFKQTMRTAPTITLYSPNTGASGNVFNSSTIADLAAAGSDIGDNDATVNITGSVAATTNSIKAHMAAEADFL